MVGWTTTTVEREAEDDTVKKVAQVSTERSRWSRDTVLGAIGIAVSLVFSVLSLNMSCRQERQWTLLNAGRLEIASFKLVGLEEIDAKTLASADYSYSPLYDLVFSPDAVYTGRVRILTNLVLWDTRSQLPIPGQLPMPRLSEATARLAAAANPALALRKQYQFQFVFRNVGQLPVRDVSIRTSAKSTPDIMAVPKLAPPVPVLGAGQDFSVNLAVFAKMDAPIPEQIAFRFDSRYTLEDGTAMSRMADLYYSPSAAAWGTSP